jgi:hypothetical protein
MTQPRWQNERAVFEFVAAELSRLRRECESWAWELSENMPTEPPELVGMAHLVLMETGMAPRSMSREEEAVERALRGDLNMLADLIRPEYLPPELNISDDPELSPPTWEIVAQFLTGERNLKTGRLKGEPGRPRMSSEERRNINPVNRAADEARIIIAILKRHYPRRSRSEIEDRAAKIAADRNGARYETLLRHLERAARDPRRIS